MSTLKTRLDRLERLSPLPAAKPEVEIWLPDNDRGGPPPGRYPSPDGKCMLVIYSADEWPPAADGPSVIEGGSTGPQKGQRA